jgi:pSer/pThr/pTyr-binding forkhead associated (FHA) protein
VLLVAEGEPDGPTMTFSAAEEVEQEEGDGAGVSQPGSGSLSEELGVEGPALVVRSGGGRTGEHFPLERTQTTIGRSPDCHIFLDDVTVSRRHAIIARDVGTVTIEDLGSLNGTFLNRRRIERAELENGDEVQIGKYRLIFLGR